MKTVVALAIGFACCALAQSAWEREMSAGDAALDPKTAMEAEQHFLAAAAAASSPAEKASALTKLGLVYQALLKKDLATTVETLYVQALTLDSRATADQALALELYSLLLTKTGRPEEAERRSATAAEIRKALVTAPGDHAPSGDVLRIGGSVAPPKLVSKQEPVYTDEARAMKHQGTVVLSIVVGTDGLVHDLRLIRSLGLGLDEQAAQAVRTWKFDPGTKDGTPANITANLTINFKLL